MSCMGFNYMKIILERIHSQPYGVIEFDCGGSRTILVFNTPYITT